MIIVNTHFFCEFPVHNNEVKKQIRLLGRATAMNSVKSLGGDRVKLGVNLIGWAPEDSKSELEVCLLQSISFTLIR